jgi:large subunit ribosomal protein L24
MAKMKMKIKTGDTVRVISGDDKGTVGTVLKVYPEAQRVLVEGVNRITKHTKVTAGLRGAKSGGKVVQEAPVHVSNVALVTDTDEGKNLPTRVGVRIAEDGTKVRVAKRGGKDIE